MALRERPERRQRRRIASVPLTRKSGKCIYPNSGVDGDGEDVPVMVMTCEVFGGAVLMADASAR